MHAPPGLENDPSRSQKASCMLGMAINCCLGTSSISQDHDGPSLPVVLFPVRLEGVQQPILDQSYDLDHLQNPRDTR